MVRRFLPLIGIACLFHSLFATAFVLPGSGSGLTGQSSVRLAMAKCGEENRPIASPKSIPAAAFLSISVLSISAMFSPLPAIAAGASNGDAGASIAANSKITTGGASTLQSGRTIAITRGVNLDNSNFSGANLKGVAFQQSIVRDADFSGSNLVGASFFDATVDGSNFDGAGE
jgi:hypothetical protein